jgi:SAM-dependent methyltransferase
MLSRVPPAGGLRVMETSPRLGVDYRNAMAQWFHYLPSDWDERAHRGAVKLDLQELRLPDRSLDVVLTAHVLEHVPETDRALAELHRVLVPGGHLFLQIPLLQGVTAPPVEPEFHGDDTPVFWRFGFDLIDRLRAHGFTTTLLCAQDWYDALARGDTTWAGGGVDPTWDVDSMLAVGRGRLADHTVQYSNAEAARVGLHHGYMCMTFACVKGS